VPIPDDLPNKLLWQHREDAQPLWLKGKAISPSAQGLIEGLLQELMGHNGVTARPTSVDKLRLALGAIVAGLMKHEIKGLWGSHGTSPKNFTSLPFGRQFFLQATSGLAALGYIDTMIGWPRWAALGGKPFNQGGRVSRYRLTGKFISLAVVAGVTLRDWKAHWTKGPSTKVTVRAEVPRLELRAKSQRQWPAKPKGQMIPIDLDDLRATELLEGVKVHNAYLDQHIIGGVSFPGLRRIFNDGDQPGLMWRRGGRYFSLPGGEPYEKMSGNDRRSELTIDGKPVGEVDLAASHLTLLYALLAEAFDAQSDPYATPGIDREVVKNWVAQALGTSRSNARRWSKRAREEYAKVEPHRLLRDAFPIGSVREAVLNRHPILYRLESSGIGPLDLQYHESEILRIAMDDLRDAHDIPSLPIHDGLIVPMKHLQIAEGVLVGAFTTYTERETGQVSQVIPSVKRKVALLGSQ